MRVIYQLICGDTIVKDKKGEQILSKYYKNALYTVESIVGEII